MLSVALLGPPLVVVDGEPLRVDTRKAIALLAYLAMTQSPTRRDTLAALLWPETSSDRARATLRRTLSTLRTALGNRWLVVEGDTVTLADDRVALDVATFRSLARGAAHDDLVTAVDLHRGDFMAGFGLRDSAAFDDWLQLETDTLRRELADALDRLSASHAARAETTAAIAIARRRLALDPLHEPAHRRLITLLAAAGERQAALEQYRACVRELDRELGVRPLEETTALYHAVLEGKPVTVEAAAPADIPASPRTAHPLVGRARELARAASALDAVGPDGRLLAVVGEAGIGKTRLAEEILARAGAGGRLAVGTRCFEEERALAYGVVVDLVRGALSQVAGPPDAWWREEVARLLPELGPPPSSPLDSVTARLRLYDAVAALLAHCAGPRGAVVVDDAHWADASSLGLLGYLTHRLEGRPLLLVLCWRPEDVPRDHLLRSLLAEARRESRATVLTPGRLTASDVAQLVVAGGLDDSLGPRLHRETGGLPFFVVEYLDALARDGTVAPEWPLPGGVRDLLERRLDDLGDLARQVVAAGAVLGRPFGPALVRETSGRGDEETVAALEELVRRGVLVEEADGSFEFRHEQARDLAYTRLSIARRRLLHRRAASTLDAGPGREARAATVAAHLAAAGADAEAAGRYRAAGDAARSLYANAEALAHYRAALALGDPDPSALHATIGDLETLAGDYGAAFASYETAVALAPPGRRGPVEWRIGLLHMRRGEWERAEASLEAAADGLDAVDAALVLADRALVAYRLGRGDDAHARADAALAAAAGVEEPRAVAQAHNVAGVLATARGDAGAAIADLEVAASVAREAGDDAARTAALNNLALALRSTGDIAQAIVVAEQALALCVPRGDRHREAAIRNNLADLLRAGGRDEDAMVQLKHAVALFAEIGEHGRLEPEIWKLSEW